MTGQFWEAMDQNPPPQTSERRRDRASAIRRLRLSVSGESPILSDDSFNAYQHVRPTRQRELKV